jgi:hypothetical protein
MVGMSPAAKRMALRQVQQASSLAALRKRQSARRFHRRAVEEYRVYLRAETERLMIAAPPPAPRSFWRKVWDLITPQPPPSLWLP